MPFNRRSDDPDDLVQTTIARHRLSRVYWLLLAVMGLALIALVASILTYTQVKEQNRQDERRAQAARQQILQVLHEIQSCTTPEGECTKRGAESGVNLSSAITYCTLNLPPKATRDEVKNCIVKELTGGS